MSVQDVQPEEIERVLARLSKRDLKLIFAIYNSPGCIMSSNELKKKTGMLPTAVGHVGKKIGRACGVTDFGSYKEGKKFAVAYFSMIGDYYELGWAMNANVRVAIKSILAKK